MRLFLHQLRAEQLLFWRTPEAAFFIFVFPILLFVLLSSLYGNDRDGQNVYDLLLVGLLAYGAANAAFVGLAITLVLRREGGTLKRLRGTPLPAPTFLAAALASTVVTFAIGTLALLAVATLLFDASLPHRPLSLVAGLAAGILAFAAMGFGAASLIRSSEAASPAVNVFILPMAFLSGSFGPVAEDAPAFLRALREVLPLRYLVDMTEAIALNAEPVWEQGRALVILGAWGLAGVVVAGRAFQWHPRHEG